MALKPDNLPDRPNLDFEQSLWRVGIRLVAGIDEAGRGPLAGPVSAAAVILPADEQVALHLTQVRDSKQLTPAARQKAREQIMAVADACGVGFASVQEIDQLGILPATRLAVSRALDHLAMFPEHLLLDYLFLRESELPQTSLVKGDRRSLSIAAASVLAKTARDEIMQQLDAQFPGYGLAAHKGYATRAHRQAIRCLGSCPIHRQSFALLGK